MITLGKNKTEEVGRWLTSLREGPCERSSSRLARSLILLHSQHASNYVGCDEALNRYPRDHPNSATDSRHETVLGKAMNLEKKVIILFIALQLV